MAGTQQGNQMAQSAMQGILPNGSQPKGAPQFYIPVIGSLQSQIAGLNKIADDVRRVGGDSAQDWVLALIDCTKKLQGMIVDMENEIKEMQEQGPGQQAA